MKDIQNILGHKGKLICGSKGLYRHNNPRNVVIFNANIFTKEGKIWYGDIDITKEEKLLIKASKELKQELFVLYESDGRSFNENDKDRESPEAIKDAILSVTKDGITVLGSLSGVVVREGKKLLSKKITPPKAPKLPKYTNQYNEHEFIKFKLPKFEYKASKISPLERFYKKLQGKCDSVSDLYLLGPDYNSMLKLMEKWFINYHKLPKDSYQFKKEMGYLALDMPCQFYDASFGPTWGEEGHFYIKKR